VERTGFGFKKGTGGQQLRIDLKKDEMEFSAAHFIVGHKRCEHLHGHNWRIGVTIEGEPDKRGLVVDFLELKKFVKDLCDRYDHRLLLPANNKLLKRSEREGTTIVEIHDRKFEFPTEDVVWLHVVNVTVEEIVRVLAREVVRILSRHKNIDAISVEVEESPGQSAHFVWRKQKNATIQN
jgi:6-pyruvoyltetrahydropterin/6-carboxytetrahydropterin synthase